MTVSGISGRVAVVSGGAGGIGRAVVARLLAEGALVAALDRDKDGLAELAGSPDTADAWTGYVDVRSAASVAECVDTVERELGPVGLLVNAAGVLRTSPVATMTDTDWADVFAVNAQGVFHLSGVVAARMVARRSGSIVTVASNAARVPRSGMAAYCASKAAAAMFTRCLGLEVASAGVRCNVVSPGSTDTTMLRGMWTDETGPERTLHGDPAAFRVGIPLGRIGAPDDVAEAVLYLLSDSARQITMQELCVDGGAVLGA